MTASVIDSPTVTAQQPRRTRSRVLFEDFGTVADTVKGKPGEWHLVGGGPEARYGVFSQTAYRIRRGLIAAFANPEGGRWEVQVSTDKRVERDHPVEVYLRFVPVDPT
ncbi:hypothetical protein [Longimicrobium sp.]|jgi:hypothetical protein|uniref:hypothetical protein n=1 Tax=Longimicrobium sp. TaxID=2029185 RepID=UPI002EDA4767